MARYIGNYQIKSTLGSGMQGKVKLALNEKTGEHVALKIINKNKIGPRELKCLYKEIQAMTMITHPNIIGFKEVFQNEIYPKKNGTSLEVVVIVLELATGGELFDFMMYTGCFPEAIAKEYFLQLLRGLQSCHARGIFHRDIKPENLLLTKDFVLKIADFGLSAIHETCNGTLSLLHTQCGTRGYMCPEVLQNKPYNGAAADIWSAGVVLFIMVAGFPPFQVAEKSDWWFRAISLGQYDAFWAAHSRSAHFSQGVMSLLNQIFVVDYTRRITIEGIFSHPWCQGNSIAPDVLFADLNRRMQQVQMEKNQQLKEQPNCSNGSGEFNPFDQNIMRSVVAEGNSVKLATTLPEVHSRRENTTTIARYTCFYSRSLPCDILSEIMHVLSSALSSQATCDKSLFKIKAKIPSPEGSIDMGIQVFRVDESQDLHVVEVHRRNGSLMKFQNLYKILCNHVSHIICGPPKQSSGDPTGSTSHEELVLSDYAQII